MPSGDAELPFSRAEMPSGDAELALMAAEEPLRRAERQSRTGKPRTHEGKGASTLSRELLAYRLV